MCCKNRSIRYVSVELWYDFGSNPAASFGDDGSIDQHLNFSRFDQPQQILGLLGVSQFFDPGKSLHGLKQSAHERPQIHSNS